jgi:hypothetical protein
MVYAIGQVLSQDDTTISEAKMQEALYARCRPLSSGTSKDPCGMGDGAPVSTDPKRFEVLHKANHK